MKRLSVRQAHDVFVVLFVLITIFFANAGEAKSLKKGEVYRSLDGGVIEVISGDKLEITEDGKTTLAKYGFKDDKLRAVFGDTVIYYKIVNEGLEDEKTGEVYYSKAGLENLIKYTDNGNGTVTHETGLMWQKVDDNTERTWKEAVTYCEGLSLGGYSDWRLPEIREIESIIDDTKQDPTINTSYFPNTKPSYYWSSSFSIVSPMRVMWHSAEAEPSYSKSDRGYVRCVRGKSKVEEGELWRWREREKLKKKGGT